MHRRARGAIAATAAIALAMPVQAAGLKLFPVRVQLTPAEPVQTMTIENSSDTPSRVQMRVYTWRQVRGEDVLEETRDILANPGQFEIPPGGTQITRFGLRVPVGGQEKSYRVILEELPGHRAPQPGQVQTLLRISIPVFVPPAQAKNGPASGQLSWRVWPSGARQLSFAIRNEGNVHVQINRMGLIRRDRREIRWQDMSVYLLPGSEKRVTLDLNEPVAAGQSLTLNAMTDQADMTVQLVTEKPPREAATP